MVKIESLEQLDAMVGRYVMHDSPEIYWEHTCSHWRFDNLSEALDALNDPFFAKLVPEGSRRDPAVTEVREFPPYSKELPVAMKVVERLSGEQYPLQLCAAGRCWCACFGEDDQVEAASAAVAICLAALRSRGIDVDLADNDELLFD